MVFIIIFNKSDIRTAFLGSWKLVNRQWWNTFALNLLGILLVYTAGLIFTMPAMLAGFSGNISAPSSDTMVNYPSWYWVVIGISSIVSTILLIIPFTFQAFQYFNLAEREK